MPPTKHYNSTAGSPECKPLTSDLRLSSPELDTWSSLKAEPEEPQPSCVYSGDQEEESGKENRGPSTTVYHAPSQTKQDAAQEAELVQQVQVGFYISNN